MNREQSCTFSSSGIKSSKSSSLGYCSTTTDVEDDDLDADRSDKDCRLSPDGASTVECSPEHTFIRKSVYLNSRVGSFNWFVFN